MKQHIITPEMMMMIVDDVYDDDDDDDDEYDDVDDDCLFSKRIRNGITRTGFPFMIITIFKILGQPHHHG